MTPKSEIIVFPDGVTYRRKGECDGCKGLALCCTYIALPLARELSPDEKYWAELHAGIRIDGQTVRINTHCSALDKGKCTLYGTSQRPDMCELYPELPGLDEGCSYEFERIK